MVPLPALASLKPGRVVCPGAFSKFLSAALRVGDFVGPPALRESINLSPTP